MRLIAHEPWFIGNTPSFQPKPLLFTSWDSVNASFVLAALFAILAAILIHFAIRPHAWTRRARQFFANYKAWTASLLRILTGLLLFYASFSRFLLEFDLHADALKTAVETSFLAIQLIVGLGLVIGLFPRFMASLGAALYLAMFIFFPPVSVLSYFFFLGIFAYLIIMGDPALPKVRGGLKFFPAIHAFINFPGAAPFSMAILRISAGFSFIFAAVINKIYDPFAALALVHSRRLNFMPSIGFANFSNEIFVLAAGLVEIALGILIILGILPRFVGAVIIIMFTLTLGFFGINELIGHLPLYAVAFALLFQGAGQRWSAELSPKPKQR